MGAPYYILFLCTGNSARSILAEAIMSRIGAGKFVAYSAGSTPKGAVHPKGLELLTRMGYPTEGLRSKSWDEFAAPGAPELHFIITVCDNAAGEICPIWPGRPVTAHWGMSDPAAAMGSDAQIALAFADAYRVLSNRIKVFASLPLDKLDHLALKARVADISRLHDITQSPDDPRVEAVSPEDPSAQPLFDSLFAWLTAANLPVSDLADDLPRYFILHGDDGRPLAFGGLCGVGPDLLVRSLVVDPAQRGQGFGARMLSGLDAIARASGAERLWLLTTECASWFETRGWRCMDRSQAPPAISATAQFSRTCPASAALLVRDLRQ